MLISLTVHLNHTVPKLSPIKLNAHFANFLITNPMNVRNLIITKNAFSVLKN